jgi:hypothetical protein
MMMLNKNILKLIILENAIVVRSYDKNPTQNFFINYICFFPFPVGASTCKPFAEPTFEQVTYVKTIPRLSQCPLILKTDLSFTNYHCET